jgi:hypothetical protein
MLYLAQVQSRDAANRANLALLACQKSEHAWVVLHDPIHQTLTLPAPADGSEWGVGMLLLVELANESDALNVVDAKNWILDVVQKFLLSGITPEFLQQETERAEQWRQSLTLQSQELDRRALELEARREQIQELEENLNRQQKALEQREQAE